MPGEKPREEQRMKRKYWYEIYYDGDLVGLALGKQELNTFVNKWLRLGAEKELFKIINK